MYKLTKFTAFLFLAIIMVFFALKVTPVNAVTNTAGIDTSGIDTAGVNSGAKTVSLTNPIGTSDVPTLIGRIIKAVLGVVGSLALLMVIYGGFTWMLAAGSSEKIKKGRDIIVWAIIGIVIIFTSYAIVTFVITSIGSTG
jgi:hypothetical protein